MNDKQFLKEVFNKISDYIDQKSSSGVVNYISGEELFKSVNDSFNGEDYVSILREIDFYLKYAVKTSHPQFNNQLNAGFTIPALAGEIISFIANTSMATYEIAPIGTILEKHLINKLNSIIGFNKGEGIMTTGGSNANMLAIHCARAKAYPECRQEGNGNKKFRIFVSEEAHYSFQKAVNLMGLGSNSLIKVKANDGVMCKDDLELKVQRSIKQNEDPLMIVSTSGTTVRGSFDNIQDSNSIAKKYKLWHHIDAAWGGPVLFSDKHKNLMEGAYKADSVTWDAHKLMATGLITSFILLKNKGMLKNANSGGGSKYLFHDYENSEFDTGSFSLQCGRKVDSLKLWLSWKFYGDEGYKKIIEEQFLKAEYFEKLVQDNPRLRLVSKRSFLNICFQIIPDSEEDINEYNLRLRFHFVKKGKSLVNFSRWADGTIFFRYVLTNFATQKEDMHIMLKNLFDAEKTLNL